MFFLLQSLRVRGQCVKAINYNMEEIDSKIFWQLSSSNRSKYLIHSLIVKIDLKVFPISGWIQYVNLFTLCNVSSSISENEQEVAPVKDQTQQVQWVRTACGVLPVLLHLGLQHPHSGTRVTSRRNTLSPAALGFISFSVFFFPDRRTLRQIPLSYGRVTHTPTWCK